MRETKHNAVKGSAMTQARLNRIKMGARNRLAPPVTLAVVGLSLAGCAQVQTPYGPVLCIGEQVGTSCQ